MAAGISVAGQTLSTFFSKCTRTKSAGSEAFKDFDELPLLELGLLDPRFLAGRGVDLGRAD